MPDAVVDWLEARLKQSRCFLEYGSGGSTRLAGVLNVPRIVSVESDRNFARAVRVAVKKSGSKSVHTTIVPNIGKTKAWGYPVGFEAFRLWPNYALRAWEFIREKNLSPDLVLIDGRFRVGCFLASLMEARPGTAILFDDYVPRQDVYGLVERYLAPSELIDRSAAFVVPESIPLRDIARALARFISVPK